MDNTRQESHAAFVQAKADLELGLQGVRQALTVLREYYGGSAAFMQQPRPAMPELHSKAEGAGNSIVGILEVVESDFAQNLAKETTEEDDAEAEYQKITQENAVTKTMKDQDEKYKAWRGSPPSGAMRNATQFIRTSGAEAADDPKYF